MLEDLRALVEFARPGPIAGAADRLFRTPSAITRQVQRPEAALGRGRAAGRVPFGHSNLIPVRLYRIDRKILLVQTALRPFPWSEPLVARLRLRPSGSRQ
ncbi:MAG: LysR family transcriptional regulator [Gammaproteobacteria bacterium]|nr:MAG: LysR family transcriptional regulator [Gammaproteobacteria bacterium]